MNTVTQLQPDASRERLADIVQLTLETHGRSWFAVIHPGSDRPALYPTHAYADAIRVTKEFEYPALGPWIVVRMIAADGPLPWADA